MLSDKEKKQISSDQFRVLCGSLEPFLENLVSEPFREDAVALLTELSSRLLSREMRSMWPDLAAFGSWIRPSNLGRLRTRYIELSKVDQGLLVPRGSSLQFAPSNVEALFAYTWAIALLCGCPTVVRVSSRRGKMTDALLSEIVQSQEKVGAVENWAFLDYPREMNEVSMILSKRSKVTVIWGGDSSVKNLRELAHEADSRVVSFPDRESLSVINVKSYLELDDASKNRLVQLFGRDVSTFGQQACSSPRRLIWVGDYLNQEARSDFSKRLSNLDTPLRNLEIVERFKIMTYTHTLASKSSNKLFEVEEAGNFSLVTLEDNWIEDQGHPGLGVIVQHFVEDLGMISRYLDTRDQTLTYFGFSKDLWQEWVHDNFSKSPLRIVPMGEALDFDSIWDGLDLIREFSKSITVH